MAKEVFTPHEPCEAQHRIPVGQFGKILTDLKPRFIHHPECKRLLPELLRELGCDLDKTYFEVPRLRTSTSAQGYLVFRPTVPAQLVDSGVRRRSGKRHGFPSLLLESARS